MGMFDWVNFEAICPVCHAKVAGFQTKDTRCLGDMVEPQTVNNFYSNCDKCGCWIEYSRRGGGDFARTVEGNDGIIKEHTKTVKA